MRNNSSLRFTANAPQTTNHPSQSSTVKTAKSSLNTNEKLTSKVVVPKASTEKKIKSRAGSNTKQQVSVTQGNLQRLAPEVSSVHSTKNATNFNKLLERQQHQQ